MSTFVYTGSDLRVYLNGTFIDNASYVAVIPQQAVLPVYSVFDDKPALFMKGNAIVKGTLGLNVAFARNLEALYGDGIISKWGEFIYYAETMTIIGFREEEATKDQAKFVIESRWMLNDVYLMGGGINAAPDGNPMQSVYNFFAKDYKTLDRAITKPGKVAGVITSDAESNTANT